ncbi:MAG: DUF4194 domain-containing protein [Thermodesulfobacteriota bacterium]
MKDTQTPEKSISKVVIQLMKGVLYQERQAELWGDLLILQGAVRDYLAVIGLALIIDETEGYAFLRQASDEGEAAEEETADMPRLISRRSLSYPLSLLCVLLRKKLAELDAEGGETRLILSRNQVVDMMRVFMPEGKNEARTVDQINTQIRKAMELGFLRKMSGDDTRFEVRRIIKALVDADWLQDLDQRLTEYKAYADENS